MGGIETLVIRDRASLELWIRQNRRTIPVGRGSGVAFQLPAFSPAQNRRLSAHANRYQRACGCTSGGFFMGLAVIAAAASYFMTGGRVSDLGPTQLLALAGIAVLAGVIGKLLGLFWAQWRLMRLATSIRNSIVGAGRSGAAASL